MIDKLWYLNVNEGLPVSFSTLPEGEENYAVDSDKLFLDAYTITNGELVYNASIKTALEVRQQRNKKLALTDWTQLGDIPSETKVKWQPYRQALRDLPSQSGFPESIIWPIEP